MKKLKHVLAALFMGFSLFSVAQQPFTAGNIVVHRTGDGTITLNPNDFFKAFLDEYTPSGTLVQSIELPSSGAQSITAIKSFTASLNLSADGRYIVVQGYNEPAGGFNDFKWAVGLVDYNGALSSVAHLTNDNFDELTSATSDDGTNLWLVNSSGVDYATVSSSSSTRINTGLYRSISIANGNLYVSSNGSSGILTVGSGLPTTSGQTALGLPGIGTTNPCQFAFADLDPTVPGVDVVYIASLGSVANGILKYSLVNGTWTLNGGAGDQVDGYAGLAIKVNGTSVTIFATRTGSNSSGVKGGDLVALTDNSGYNGTLTGTPSVISSVLGRFGTNDKAAFRGIALVPQAPSVKVSIKAFLQGAYSNALSHHKDVTTTWAAVLNANATSQPYNTTPFNYAGTESVSNGFFTSNPGASTDILDWVLLELRDASNVVVSRRAAFIREDGQIVDTDGSSPVSFINVSSGNYYVVVRHRNHLSIRSANTIALSGTATSYDFTTAQSQAFQNGSITTNAAMATKDLPGTETGKFLMWGGNANSDGFVRAGGGASLNDYLTLLGPTALQGDFSKVITNVYRKEDMNLDGVLRAGAALNVNDYLTLLSPGILQGNFSGIISAH